MNDKIKEKLAFVRLLISFNLLAIFGIIGWINNIYEKYGVIDLIYLGLSIVLLLFVWYIFLYKKIVNLIKKL